MATGKRDTDTNAWNSCDPQVSDDDDDEPRLMIDTSADEEDGAPFQMSTSRKMNIPMNFTEVSPERIKVLAEATPTLDKFMKDVKIPPELDKLLKDVSADLKKQNKNQVPENFAKAMNAIKSSPNFQKAIYDMELPQDLVKALDEMKRLQQGPSRSGKSTTVSDPKVLTPGCEKTTKESSSMNDYPLFQLEDFVRNPWNELPGDVMLNSKISPTTVTGSQGCEILPIVGVSSKSMSSNKAPPSIKTNAKPRSTTKRGKSQLPSLRLLTTVPNRSKSNNLSNPTVGRSQPPPAPKPLPSKIHHVVNTLHNAACDEKNMYELQRMSHSDEAEKFRIFQSFIKTHLKDVSVVPPAPCMRTSEQSPTNRTFSVPLPPALTIIPKEEGQWPLKEDIQWSPLKTSFLRNPPPMVPIGNFTNMNKPFNDEHVVLRLKRLGTDIELERTTVPTAASSYATNYGGSVLTEDDDDDDSMIPLSVDCITEPIVTIDETPDPIPLKCFDMDPAIPRKGFMRCVPPQPPSLIPISTANRNNNVPRVSCVPNLTLEARSHMIKKKPKRKQKTAFKSDIAKLAHALVQPAGAVKNNELEIMNAFCRSPSFQDRPVTIEREVEIFKIEDKPAEKAIDETFSNLTETIRLIETPLENKTASESSLIENEEFSRDDVRTASMETLSEVPENSISKTASDILGENGSFNDPPNENENLPNFPAVSDALTNVKNDEPASPSEEQSQLEELPSVVASSSTVSQLFVFHSDSAVGVSSLPTGRKLYTCKICSGVYCKMYSAKKHYLRNHINPRMVSERDATKFGLETSARKSPANEGFYRCNECGEIFFRMLDLKRHLLDHPVAANETSKCSRKGSLSYVCENCNLTFAKKKFYHKHVTNCVKVTKLSIPMSTKSAEEQDNLEDSDEEKKDALGISRMCLFCDLTFTSTTARKTHVLQQHHPKRKHQSCSYCKNRKFSDLKDLLKHVCDVHSKRYFGCPICKIRFKTRGDLTAHNAESHPLPESSKGDSKIVNVEKKNKSASATITKSGKIFKCGKCSKTFPTDKELKRHRKKGHGGVKSTSNVKTNGTISASDSSDQKYRTANVPSVDHDTEYYRNVAQNNRFNFEFCLDGKLPNTTTPNDLKTVTRSGLSQHLKTRSSAAQHLRMEGDSENRLTFEDMYGAQNLNGPFIANMSRLHLATQLEILRKANRLEKEPKIESTSTTYRTSITMAKELALTENSGSTEFSEGIENNHDVVFSGEWTRPKKYICSTCFARFSNFWDMEDHRWVKHPNVWVSHYEFPLDQAPGLDWTMRRCLQKTGVLNKSSENNSVSNGSPASTCTKCHKVVTPTAEFHKHILECGGDTTWMSTMFASSSLKKNKRWKPYGSRRRRNVGRVRGLKRNIPTTPVKIIGMSKNRQKAGDTESIQRMIANLPPKRITRRIIQFDDVEPRSQSRNNAENNIQTRRRKEKLNAKPNTQNAKKLPINDNVAAKMTDSRKKKQKEGGTLRKKSVKASKSSPISSTITKSTKPRDQVADTSVSNVDLEVSVKEKVEPFGIDAPRQSDVRLPSVMPLVGAGEPAQPESQEEPELDLENMEPADSDSLIPDSSVILAAMRETMRQTDAVVSSVTFSGTTAKKRKRDDMKVKPESQVSESCVEPETKPVAQLLGTCSECKNSFTKPDASNVQICENCSLKRGRTHSVSVSDNECDIKPNDSDSQHKCSVESIPKHCDESARKSIEIEQKYTIPRADAQHDEMNLQESPGNFDEPCGGDDNSETSKIVKKDRVRKTLPGTKTSSVKSKKSITEAKKGVNKASKREKIIKNVRNLRNTEANRNGKRSEANELVETQVSKSTKTSKTLIKNSKIDKLCDSKDDPQNRTDLKNCQIGEGSKIDEINANERNVEIIKPPVELVDSTKYARDVRSGVEINTDDVETKITTCAVCHGLSIHPICDNCSSIARKNKICAFCKQKLPPKSNALAICEECKISQYVMKTEPCAEVNLLPKRELVEWTQCKVCRRTNHKVVCSSCVVMSQKHKICARCNVRWEDPHKTGMPVCSPCEKEWYPRPGKDEEVVDKCAECSTLLTHKMTFQRLCNECNAGGTPVQSCESMSKGNSNEISVHVNDVENTSTDLSMTTPVIVGPSIVPKTATDGALANTNTSSSTIPVMPSNSVLLMVASNASVIPSSVPSVTASTSTQAIITSTMSGVSTLQGSKTTVEETQTNTSPTKKNVILICKGCFGLYDKVSAYKQHCDTCLARVSCMDEKKPLLGFVKRNPNVVSNETNSGGASFEILEGVQIKSYPVNESGKIESDQSNDVFLPVPGSVYDSDSSTSSKRLEFCKSPKMKRSLASDESISEAIESVIKAVCSDSMRCEESNSSSPVSKSSSRRPSNTMEETSTPDLEKFEQVRNQLESLLKTSKAENESSEISFPNDEQTSSSVEVPNVSKKKKMIKKEKVLNSGRTTRSSSTRFDENVAKATDEISKTTSLKLGKRRKISSMVSLPTNEETTNSGTDTSTIAKRLRRKQVVETTNRTLRSRSKLEVRDYVDEDEKIGEVSVEQVSNLSNKVKNSRESKKKTDNIDQQCEDRNQESVTSDEEDLSEKTPTKKPKSEANYLRFAGVRGNKTTRKTTKRDSFESSETLSKNELPESDRQVETATYALDGISTDTHERSNDATDETRSATNVTFETSTATNTEYPIHSQNMSDFLGVATPSTSAATHDECIGLNGFSYEESMRMVEYEVGGPTSFDEGQPEGTQSNSWYSAINFLDQSSLGSILASVNELLSGPEVASPCVTDTLNQSLRDQNSEALILQSLDDGIKTKDENSLNQEDESPTLMDLDHQTAHHSEPETKENDETSTSSDQDQTCENNADMTKEVCDLCEQSYPDLKSLKMHIAAVHQANAPTTRSVANGKFRPSTRNYQNGVKAKQKCSHCQKVLVGKAEMASHLKEHLQTFALNKNNAEFLKKCITEKLEDIFLNKAMDNYMKSPQESSNVRNNPPLKILSQLNAAKKNQFGTWKSAIAQMLNLDASSSSTVSPNNTGTSADGFTSSSKSIKPSKNTSSSAGILKSDVTSADVPEKEGYPCPMCPKTFQLTHLRNQHLIMVHAPRQSTHKHLKDSVGRKKDNSMKSLLKNDKNGLMESSTQSDGKVMRSYLLNESVNSCLEAKKEAVNRAIAESSAKTLNELQKFMNRPSDASNTTELLCNMQSVEGPPALEPASSGEQILNNTDRSPPKLEVPAGLPVPSILRQNLTTSGSSRAGPSQRRNGKPRRKKMSKKEMDLPPAVVKFKAEQALLELSINKFKRPRTM